MKKETMKKQTSKAFGKKVYLIGENKQGEYLWLEESKWDCGWYWGFGYIEIYTNNKHPELSKDINSHTHFNGEICGFKNKEGEYIHHPNINGDLVSTTLTDAESWKLAEYMETCYTLRKSADTFHRGGSHLTSCKEESTLIKNETMEREINNNLLPSLFKMIDNLLSPVA